MARPQKQTVVYFPHDTNACQGRTLTILQSKYGNDGYAFWFQLLELLGSTNGHYYCYQNAEDLEYLTAKTHQKSTETILAMLNLLDVLGAIDHDLYLNKIIWTQRFVDGVADAYRRAKGGIPTKPPKDGVNVSKTSQTTVNMPAETPKSDTETPQTKLNYTKLNNTTLSKDKDTAQKKKYGEFQNVLLTDEELGKLKERYPKQFEPTIERLSGYCEAHGKKYKSYYAAILNWIRRNGENQGNSPPREPRRQCSTDEEIRQSIEEATTWHGDK